MTLRQYEIIKDDVNFERKLDEVTEGGNGGKYLKDHLLHRITRENCLIIVSYILAMQVEINPSERYRLDTIARLKRLSEFHHPKSFKDMTRQDILDYLDRFRKKPESVDHMHKSIGTHEITRITLIRFFRWLYNPDIYPSKNRPKPAVVDNIPKIQRKEQSTYKPTDLWTQQDDALFYKYCPSKRDRCYHAISRDTGCRPDELLKLKIKDLNIAVQDAMHIVRIQVNGKTGARNVRVSNGYPHLKDWLTNGHPYGSNNPNAPLFCGVGKKTFGKRLTNSNAIYQVYLHHKTVTFPKVLQDPLTPEDDKRHIRELLKKPWNPHLRRHTSATEISKILHNDTMLDSYFGWSSRGHTRERYKHYFGDDAVNMLLTVGDGLNLSKTPGPEGKNPLKPIKCPNCDETNKPEAKFCAKCTFVLSFDALNNNEEVKNKELEQMKNKVDVLTANIESLFVLIGKDNELLKEYRIKRKEGDSVIDYLMDDDPNDVEKAKRILEKQNT